MVSTMDVILYYDGFFHPVSDPAGISFLMR